jgi:DNA-binding NtrC family response regulator
MDIDDVNQTIQMGRLPEALSRPRVSLLVYHLGGVEAVTLGPDQTVVIGRAPPSDLPVPDPSLSREHARFILKEDAVEVEDLGSTNGTRVNGKPVKLAVVAEGDEVGLGAVTVSIHEVQGGLRGVEGQERFLVRLQDEVARAKFYSRQLSVLLLRPVDEQTRLLGWCPAVLRHLRPVDRLGLAGAETLAVAMPEASRGEAIKLAGALVDEVGADLRAGIVQYPEDGKSASKLMRVAHRAQEQTSAATPVRDAATLRDLQSWVDGDMVAAAGQPLVRARAMRELYDTVDRLARSTIPVLIIGDTGAGKELVARALHDRGKRSDGPMRSVNCAAIPDQLIESVMFGHERGAFTGATQMARGVFEEASGGTVLLDEVGELSPPAQAALLRALETKRISRVGSAKEIDVDVRIVAATHCDLEAMCDRGDFRWDLLFRLNTMVIKVPPLRERADEIEPLARLFLARAREEQGAEVESISEEALEVLRAYHWPGNVRELRNEIERAAVIARGTSIEPGDFSERVRSQHRAPDLPARSDVSPVPPSADGDEEGVDFKTRVENFERRLILEALERTGWKKTVAAEALRIPIRTLTHKIRTYRLREE